MQGGASALEKGWLKAGRVGCIWIAPFKALTKLMPHLDLSSRAKGRQEGGDQGMWTSRLVLTPGLLRAVAVGEPQGRRESFIGFERAMWHWVRGGERTGDRCEHI